MGTELRPYTITLPLGLDLTLAEDLSLVQVLVQREQVTNRAKFIVNKLSWLSKQTELSVEKVLGKRTQWSPRVETNSAWAEGSTFNGPAHTAGPARVLTEETRNLLLITNLKTGQVEKQQLIQDSLGHSMDVNAEW